jgi:hypothetical protein
VLCDPYAQAETYQSIGHKRRKHNQNAVLSDSHRRNCFRTYEIPHRRKIVCVRQVIAHFGTNWPNMPRLGNSPSPFSSQIMGNPRMLSQCAIVSKIRNRLPLHIDPSSLPTAGYLWEQLGEMQREKRLPKLVDVSTLINERTKRIIIISIQL